MNELENKIIKKCLHYKNNIQIYAYCCNQYYDCHMCHNENTNHNIATYKLNKIKCINCNSENNLSNECYNCKITFSEKFCNICNIWTNEKKYHCVYCNICVYGYKDKLYHCHKCNRCMHINYKLSHKCKEQKEEICPICLDSIVIDSYKSYKLLCGHYLHKTCYFELIKNTNSNKVPSCTLCKKSIISISYYENKFDHKMIENPVDDYYKNWKTNIICNDCLTKSKVVYHNYFHKCDNCKSYNTNIINIEK